MIKKSITFDDLEGNSITKDFYFHMNKAELTKMELSTEGGFVENLQAIIKANNGAQIVKAFNDLLLAAYGAKNPNGISFDKSDELRTAFENSDAYSELFMSIATDSNEMLAFFKGVLPKDMAASIPDNVADLSRSLPDGDKLRSLQSMTAVDVPLPATSTFGVPQPQETAPDSTDVMRFAKQREDELKRVAAEYLPPDRGE